MRCGERFWVSFEISNATSPLICGRLSPAAHEIRTCGSANSSARKRSASTCRLLSSERSPASLWAARPRVRISRIAATTEKPSTASAVASTATSWRLRSKKLASACSIGCKSPACAGALVVGTTLNARPTMPSRTSDVHVSKVRRIAAITSDMVRPKPHDFAAGASPHRSRIDLQYPLREDAGKSPNRERKLHCRKMRGLDARGRNFSKTDAPSAARRSETAAAAVCRRELCNGDEFRPDHRSDHHLGDALAAPDRERYIAVVDQEHAHFAAVILVDRAGRV